MIVLWLTIFALIAVIIVYIYSCMVFIMQGIRIDKPALIIIGVIGLIGFVTTCVTFAIEIIFK